MAELKTPNEDIKVEPVRVSVGMGFKRNTGNYENLDIHVALSASAGPDEKAAEAFDRVYNFVEARLLEKFAETEAELRGQGLGEAN